MGIFLLFSRDHYFIILYCKSSELCYIVLQIYYWLLFIKRCLQKSRKLKLWVLLESFTESRLVWNIRRNCKKLAPKHWWNLFLECLHVTPGGGKTSRCVFLAWHRATSHHPASTSVHPFSTLTYHTLCCTAALATVARHTGNFVPSFFQLILPGMLEHPTVLGIQMAATACLYNLSKSTMGQKIHPRWLRQIVMLTLTAMENFPRHQQVSLGETSQWRRIVYILYRLTMNRRRRYEPRKPIRHRAGFV